MKRKRREVSGIFVIFLISVFYKREQIVSKQPPENFICNLKMVGSSYYPDTATTVNLKINFYEIRTHYLF